MSKIGNGFGNAAVCLTVMGHQDIKAISVENWEKLVKKFLEKKCYVKKECPKNTYFGMCSKGLVKGIPEGNYLEYETIEVEYAKIAIKLLKENEIYSKNLRDLWRKVMKEGGYDEEKNYDFQMDVVCALWNAGFIKTD